MKRREVCSKEANTKNRMTIQETRLLLPESIPASLYDKSAELIVLPAELIKAYRSLVEGRGLLGEAGGPRKDALIGGLTQAATDDHLCHAFDGSAARTLLALLDPKSEATPVSNAFVESLSGNQVCLLDAPCGSGAASLSVLTAIAELRAAGVLPRHPLDVKIIGAEPAESARTYASALTKEVRAHLRSQAIFVNDVILMHWDVLDPTATVDLIQAVLQHAVAPSKRFCLVANFSGFLGSESKQKTAMAHIDDLFLHVSRGGALAVWLEPKTNKAIGMGGLLRNVATVLRRWISAEGPTQGGGTPIFTSESNFRPALRPGQSVVRLAVLRFDLKRS
jgi:hypothetical protein